MQKVLFSSYFSDFSICQGTSTHLHLEKALVLSVRMIECIQTNLQLELKLLLRVCKNSETIFQ